MIEQKGFRWLARIEQWIFRRDTMELAEVETRQLAKIFCFRLIAFLPVFFISLMSIGNVVTYGFANDWGPFQSVFPNHFFYLLR
jgi:hypothetical protein